VWSCKIISCCEVDVVWEESCPGARRTLVVSVDEEGVGLVEMVRTCRFVCSRDRCVVNVAREFVNMWKVLAGEEGILQRVFAHLLEVLSLSLPYQERNKNGKVVRLPTDVPLSVSVSSLAISLSCQIAPPLAPPTSCRPLRRCQCCSRLKRRVQWRRRSSLSSCLPLF